MKFSSNQWKLDLTRCSSLKKNSGAGTVVAIAALATTLFRPQNNIHNML